MMSVFWYYRPEQTEVGRIPNFHGEVGGWKHWHCTDFNSAIGHFRVVPRLCFNARLRGCLHEKDLRRRNKFTLGLLAEISVRVVNSSLRSSSLGRSGVGGGGGGGGGGGREKEGDLGTASLEFKFHLQFPCGSPSTELSDFRQSARSGNERECKETLKG